MREVDEAVRQDEVATFAKKYGWPLGIGLVLALAAFAGFLWWQSNSEGELEQASEQLTAALDELEAGNMDIADKELAAISASDGAAAGAIATLLRGGIAMEKNDRASAAGLFGQVANNADLPQELRDLATIRQVSAEFDEMEPQAVIDRIGAMALPDSAFYGSAGELVAFAYLAQEKPEQAGPLLVAIAQDENVPESIRERTRQLAGLIGFDAIKDVEQTLEELGAGENPAGATQAAPAAPAP